MIEIALILAATVVALSEFWEDIVNFLKETAKKVKRAISGILYGTKVFVQKMGSVIQEIAHHYSKVGNQWQETVYSRNLNPNQVPPDILERAKREEKKNRAADITNETEMVLSA